MSNDLKKCDVRGFDRGIGQNIAKNLLAKAASGDGLFHAYLFLGLAGSGKLTTALQFAKALNCENTQPDGACDECPICSAIEHGNSPDVSVWSPDGQNTKIDQMREMREMASFRPVRARYKVNIIEKGDTLNEESANAILKLVEEPPSYVINIICYENAAAVIPTIRSRCFTVRFTSAGETELAQRLVSDYATDETQARLVASISQGLPGRAIGLLADFEHFVSERKVMIKVAEVAGRKMAAAALKLAELMRTEVEKAEDEKKKDRSAREVTTANLDILALWYRDLMNMKAAGTSARLVNLDKTTEIAEHCKFYESAVDIEKALQEIIETKRAVLGNANPQIATEDLAIKLAG